MDAFLRNLIDMKIKIGKLTFTFLQLFFLFCITAAGIMLRSSVFSVSSGDYASYIQPWISEFKAWGSLQAITSDYYISNIPVLYILYIIGLLPGSPMLLLKVFLGIFDFILAVLAGYLVSILTKDTMKTILAYGIMTVLPTVVASSMMWAQFEVVSAVFVLLSLCFIVKEKPYRSILCYAIATLFVSQALLLLPLYMLLWIKRKVGLQHLLLVPIAAVISFVPAVLAGRNIKECFYLYVLGGYADRTFLTRNFPNIYEIIGKDALIPEISTVSVLIVAGILMCILYYLSKKQFLVTPKILIQTALFISMFMTFFLPFMQERCGYVADVLAVIFVFTDKKKFYIPILQVLISYMAYSAYFSGKTYVSMRAVAFVLLFLIFMVGRDLYKLTSNLRVEPLTSAED